MPKIFGWKHKVLFSLNKQIVTNILALISDIPLGHRRIEEGMGQFTDVKYAKHLQKKIGKIVVYPFSIIQFIKRIEKSQIKKKDIKISIFFKFFVFKIIISEKRITNMFAQ